MLLEDGESSGKNTLIMVSQPRRIAATALRNRLQEALGGKVGLKLGNGVISYIFYFFSVLMFIFFIFICLSQTLF